jgi:hypothetical protein
LYNNACNLLAYMLNRALVWAKNVQVFINALHFKGHTGCAIGLDAGVDWCS